MDKRIIQEVVDDAPLLEEEKRECYDLLLQADLSDGDLAVIFNCLQNSYEREVALSV